MLSAGHRRLDAEAPPQAPLAASCHPFTASSWLFDRTPVQVQVHATYAVVLCTSRAETARPSKVCFLGGTQAIVPRL
jgi:hypothetical protein